MRIQEKFTQKLLVEGSDDQHVVWAICEKFQVAQTFDVVDCGGKDQIIEQIPTRLKQSGLKTLGIILDADTDLISRWASVRGLFSTQGFTLAVDMPSQGLVVGDQDQVRIGIWLMPNNQATGMLEDFIRFLVPDGDRALPFAEGSFTQLETEKINSYPAHYRAKALIHTWLAWQADPGTPLGLAITKRYLTTEGILCQQFVDWLNLLFNGRP
jgi:hypothetical protein